MEPKPQRTFSDSGRQGGLAVVDMANGADVEMGESTHEFPFCIAADHILCQ